MAARLAARAWHPGSALALAKSGEYIAVVAIIVWASRALFMYSK